MNNKIKFVISLTVCQLAGVIGSVFTSSSVTTWYPTLTKPNFSPPGWIFAPVWIALYFLMGVSLYLIWINKAKDNGKALILFAIQLILNVLHVFWFKISFVWVDRYTSSLSGNSIYNIIFVQDISSGCNSLSSLFSMGKFCHNFEL